jgi:AsmA protein
MRTNRSSSRRLLYFFVGLLALLGVLAVGTLQALKSVAARSRIASALSNALGQPVAIGGLTASLLPTPSLSARFIRIGGVDSAAAPGVSLEALHIVPRLSSILPGRTLTIDHVDLTGLIISVRRDSAGRWWLPVPPTPSIDTSHGGTAIDLNQLRARSGSIRVVDDQLRAPAGGPTVTTITGVEADMQAVGGRVKVSRFTGRLGKSVVTGSTDLGPDGAVLKLRSESIHQADVRGLFALAGMQASPLLSIAGKAPFEMTISLPPGFATHTATGKAAVERVQFGTLAFEGVQAPFHLERGVFTLDPLTFTTYGGRQQGTVSVDLNQPAAVYTIRTSVKDLDVNRALSANTTMQNFLAGRGRLAGNVRGSGNTVAALKRTLTGTLEFELTNGVIRDFPLLAAINQALGVTEGTDRDTKFQSLSGTATLGGGRARTNDLVLRAGELSLTGKGTLGFDQRLDLRMTASISPAMSSQLIQRVGLLKRLSNDRGQVTFPVIVTGTTTAPKISVDLGSMAKKELEEKVEKGLLEVLQ